MISELQVVEAIKNFCKPQPDGSQSEWMKALWEAPQGAKMRMALAFWFSTNQAKMDDTQKEEYRRLREAYESGLTREDLEYLANLNLFPEQTREHYKELLAKVGGGQPITANGTEG